MTLGDTALTTLATVKARLGISDSSSDSLLEALINAASGAIVSFVGRSLHYEEDIEEYVIGTGRARLSVSRAPIWSIDSIAFDGSAIDSASYEVRGRDKYTGHIMAVSRAWTWTTSARGGTIAQDPIVSAERYRYLVTYTAGYATPTQSPVADVEDLPTDIQEACILATQYLYAQVGKDTSVASESLLSYSVSYDRSAVSAYGLPLAAQAMLAPYRWIPIA